MIDGLNAQPIKYNPNAANSPYNGLTGANGGGQSLGDAINLGTLIPQADITEVRYNMGFQYGITDRLTIGFNVPLVKVNASLNASVGRPKQRAKSSYRLSK